MNTRLLTKFEGILRALEAAHFGTTESPSAVKGRVRANFAELFLRKVLPPAFRVSQGGHIIDSKGSETGEVDIVIENGFCPSFPPLGIHDGRTFLAESVAAVIEVKSDLAGQWDETLATARKVQQLKRDFGGHDISLGRSSVRIAPFEVTDPHPIFRQITLPPQWRLRTKVPYIVVGYTGWQRPETIREKIDNSGGTVDAVLQVDKRIFASNEIFGGMNATGPLCLLGLLSAVQEASTTIRNASISLHSYGE